MFGLEATGGGALKHLTYLVAHIDKGSFDITVILSKKRLDYNSKLIEQIKRNADRVVFIPMARKIEPVNDFVSFFRIFQQIRKNNYDIVHCHSSKAGVLFRLAAWINKVPLVIYTPHCFYFQSKLGIGRKVYSWLEKFLTAFCHKVVVSEHEQKVALAEKVISPEKLTNINNAIDFNEYKQHGNIQEIKNEWKIPTDYEVIGAVGRLDYQKDWFTFIDVASIILEKTKSVIFLIAGDGPLRLRLTRRIHELELSFNIRLLGHVENISKVYAVSDLYISTSLWEGLPYTFLEAAYFNKPVVASVTNNNMCLEQHFGFVETPVRQSQDIAQQVLGLLRDKRKEAALKQRIYNTVTAKYSFEQFILEHEWLYLNR